MPATSWTIEQILALAPDANSAKASRSLAKMSNWHSLAYNEQAAWGECKSSGATPYRTKIELGEPAFHCSCPSRKFPCKHALALFLLLSNEPDNFQPEATPPEWVAEWLATRAARAEKRSRREERPAPNSTAQNKRAAERQKRIESGLQESKNWLHDLVRQGLADAQGQPYQFWEGPAARMVDSQAPGLARLLREMAGLPVSGNDWAEKLLERMARLHLAMEGFKNLEKLPAWRRADLRVLVGWSISQEELAALPPVHDRWTVLGKLFAEEEGLRTQRTWLVGEATQRPALLLDFARSGQPFDINMPTGMMIEADLIFYPSAFPMRAALGERHGSPTPLDMLRGAPTIASGIEAYQNALAQHPLLDSFPLAFEGVVPRQRGKGWIVQDLAGDLLPLDPSFSKGWHLLALSGGHPLTLFGQWDGNVLLPISAYADRRFVVL